MLGPDHPDTLGNVKNLEFCRAMSTAEDRYHASLAKFGPDDIKTLLSRCDVVDLYRTTNRLDEAEQTVIEIIGRSKDRPADDTICLATTALLRKSLKIREERMPDSWPTFQSKSLLGEALLARKKYADAEPLLLAGYEGMKKQQVAIPTQDRARLAEAIERLVKLYEATDKKDEAMKWRKELEVLRETWH